MATAASLTTEREATLAYVLEIEGVGRLYTDVADTAGILTAWTGSGHTQISAVLEVPSAITRRIDLLGFRVEVVGQTIRLLEYATNGLVSLFADAKTSVDVTYLTADVDRDDTTINAADTTAFAASGTIHIGHERITYTGKTATSFTGCTRGVLGFGGLSHTHTVGEDGPGPEVAEGTVSQRVWKGRGVTIYIAAKQGDGTWTTRANSIVYFAGYMKGGWKHDSRNGTWTLDCISVENRMEHQLLRDQYRARVEGIVIPSDITWTIHNKGYSGGALYAQTVSLTIQDGSYTLEELIDHINAQFNAAYTGTTAAGGLNDKIGLALVTVGDTWRVRFERYIASATSGQDYRTDIIEGSTISPDGGWLLKILGFTDGSALWYGVKTATATAAMSMTVNGSYIPIKTLWDPAAHVTITVTDAQGTWVDQETDDLPGIGTAHGFIMVDGEESLWLVTKSGATFTHVHSYTLDGKPLAGAGPGPRVVYMGDDRTIEVKQAWLAEGKLSKLLLRMLLSTGTDSYNTAHDVWPLQMGLGIPSTFVDVNAILALDTGLGAAAKLRMVVTEPTAAVEEIESMMRARGFALVWDYGEGRIRPVISTNPTGLAADWTLDEDNTDINGDGIDTEDGSELVRNKLTLLYNRDPGSGEYMARETYVHTTSASDHEQPDPIEMEARSLYDVAGGSANGPLDIWRKNVAAPFAAYFERPIRRYIVTGAPSLVGISPGDIVEFTHPDAPNQETGSYGVTELKCWVESVAFDPAEHTFTLSLLVPRGKAYTMAPTAMLDYSRGDVGYDNTTSPGSPFLYCRDHEFSLSTEAVDVAAFDAVDANPPAVDMRVSVIEADPPDPATALRWDNLLVLDSSTTAGSTYIQVDAALAGFDTAKRYYVEYDDYDNLVNDGSTDARTEQEAHAFIADDADNLIGASSALANLWSMFLAGSTSDVATGQDLFKRRANIADDNGEPLSVWKLRDAITNAANLYRYVTNPQPIDRNYTTARSVTATSYQYLAGPFCVLVPPGVTQMTLTLWMQMSSGGGASPKAYARITVSPSPPTGTATAMSFPAINNQTEVTSTTTSGYEEKSATVTLIPAADGRCWLTIEGKGSETNDVSRLGGIQGAFVAPTVS